MSEKIGVYAAIAAVSKDMATQGISKDRKNQQGSGYNFRGIDDVLNALSPSLVEHGLVIIPRCIERESVERQTKAGGAIFYTTVKVEFDFISVSDGSKHTAVMYGEAMDTSDKSTNKAMSAAYKYVAFQTFCIPTEGDNDADLNTHEVAPKAKLTEADFKAFEEIYCIDMDELKEKFIALYNRATTKDEQKRLTAIKDAKKIEIEKGVSE